jgi:hypothetical protein
MFAILRAPAVGQTSLRWCYQRDENKPKRPLEGLFNRYRWSENDPSTDRRRRLDACMARAPVPGKSGLTSRGESRRNTLREKNHSVLAGMYFTLHMLDGDPFLGPVAY